VNSEASLLTQVQNGRRRLLVWAIFLFYAYSLASMAVGYRRGYFSVGFGNGIRIPAPKSTAEKAIRAGILLLTSAAALELVRMKEAAVPLFFAAWIARAMLTTYDVANVTRGRHFVAVPILILIPFAVFTALVAYVLSLHRKALLRPGA
jgi:hypothetical protein